MTDTAEPGLPRVLSAALEVFAEKGYHGASIRDIASAAGLSVPGVYHHYGSKQEILAGLVATTMDDLLARTRAALESVDNDPVRRFDAVVEALLRFHLERSREAFVASSEIRSLEPDNRRRHVAARDEQQQMLHDVVAAGHASGDFVTPYPDEAVRSVAVLCVGTATWYRSDGPLDADELVDRHLVLARALVGGARPG
ncbi:MAG: TetR family transcriptional regulator [Marmoricola sp.]|nr:TetR family transcriptional regulator [Marmoricola sp.]